MVIVIDKDKQSEGEIIKQWYSGKIRCTITCGDKR